MVVLGSSISALMTAAWLKHRQPELSVTVVGPRVGEEQRPVVGESLVEPAILFFLELGMGPYLEARHELKNGLTFYHKLAPDDPSDRRYSVHMPMDELYHRARQLHRPAFDIELARVARRLGVEFVEGRASEVEVGRGRAEHRVRGEDSAHGRGFEIEASFVVDATGRRRLLGRQVTRYLRPDQAQRSAFWFRLADFDPLLPGLELSWRRPARYDLWLSTHHFMGKGNWIWGIPLRGEGGERLLSMGITWRPDLFEGDIRSIDDFLAQAEGEHPAIAQMVRSGRVLDAQHYRNYLYKAEQVYSGDGWFLVGDAAGSVDPLYSTGLSMTVVQIEQIDEIIRRRRGPGISNAEIGDLQALWMMIAGLRQADIGDQYRTMNDPFHACLRRYWNLCGWFNGVLPLWFNGYFSDPAAARVLRRFFAAGVGSTQAAWALFEGVSKQLGTVDQSDFDRLLDFDWLINRRFDCRPEEVRKHLSRLLWKRARLRLNLISMAGPRHLSGQIAPLVREFILAALVRTLVFRHPALRGVGVQRGVPGRAGSARS